MRFNLKYEEALRKAKKLLAQLTPDERREVLEELLEDLDDEEENA